MGVGDERFDPALDATTERGPLVAIAGLQSDLAATYATAANTLLK